MSVRNPFFYIHYCNRRENADQRGHLRVVRWTTTHHELALATGGAGRMLMGKRTYPIQKGMLFYLRPGEEYSVIHHTATPASFLTVRFSYARVTFSEGIWGIEDGGAPLSIPPAQELKNYRAVEYIFNRLVESWTAKRPNYAFAAKTLLQQLIIVVERPGGERPGHSTEAKVERAIEYMHRHIGERLALSELSEVAGLSPFYLSKAFRRATGYSTVEYFNRMKIDKAKELLVEGEDKKVKEVARKLGFADEFYFSRLFKKIEGVSPSEFHSKIIHDV